jgi:hypothetical protein
MRRQNGSQSELIGYDGTNIVYQIMPDTGADKEFIPLLVIPLMMKQMLISAFIEEASKMKMSTKNESALEGKIEAMGIHLNDMRNLSHKLTDFLIQKQSNIPTFGVNDIVIPSNSANQ